MCLDVNSLYHPYDKRRSLTAKKDIYTLKTLRNVNLSKNTGGAWLQKGYSYEFNKLLKTKIKFGHKSGFNRNSIFEGFHSFHCGFGVCRGDEFIGLDGVVLCKIPKGSRFYVGYNSDIVSDSIEIYKCIMVGHQYRNKILDSELWLHCERMCKNDYSVKIGLGCYYNKKLYDKTPSILRRIINKIIFK